MRPAKYLLLMLPLVPALFPPSDSRSGTQGLTIEKRIDLLLAQMTLDEKIGQLAQYSAPFDSDPKVQRTKEDEYKAPIRQGRVGSLYNFTGAAKTNELQRVAVEESRLHIPLIFAFDVIHGYRTASIYGWSDPNSSGRSCRAWHPDLVGKRDVAPGRRTAGRLRRVGGPGERRLDLVHVEAAARLLPELASGIVAAQHDVADADQRREFSNRRYDHLTCC